MSSVPSRLGEGASFVGGSTPTSSVGEGVQWLCRSARRTMRCDAPTGDVMAEEVLGEGLAGDSSGDGTAKRRRMLGAGTRRDMVHRPHSPVISATAPHSQIGSSSTHRGSAGMPSMGSWIIVNAATSPE
jgi:hypothetical protein